MCFSFFIGYRQKLGNLLWLLFIRDNHCVILQIRSEVLWVKLNITLTRTEKPELTLSWILRSLQLIKPFDCESRNMDQPNRYIPNNHQMSTQRSSKYSSINKISSKIQTPPSAAAPSFPYNISSNIHSKPPLLQPPSLFCTRLLISLSIPIHIKRLHSNTLKPTHRHELPNHRRRQFSLLQERIQGYSRYCGSLFLHIKLYE